jgi:predicted small lipoprotein YifL
MRTVVSSLVLLALIAACGYKGPLSFPKSKPEAPAAAPAPVQDPKKAPKDGQ